MTQHSGYIVTDHEGTIWGVGRTRRAALKLAGEA